MSEDPIDSFRSAAGPDIPTDSAPGSDAEDTSAPPSVIGSPAPPDATWPPPMRSRSGRIVRRASGPVVVLALILFAFVGGIQVGRSDLGPAATGAFGGDAAGSLQPPAPARATLPLLYEAWNLVDQHYVDQSALDPTTLTYGAITGLLAALGDTGHTDFLTPQEAADSQSDLSGQYVGIGVELAIRKDGPAIVGVFDGSPAKQAGLRVGDRILAVGGQDVTSDSYDALRAKLRGPVGTTVVVTILHAGDTVSQDVTVSRAQIKVPSVTWAMIPGHAAADIRLQQFSNGAGDELKKALGAARAAGARSIVLDLRGNPGGYVNEAVTVASQFLSSGNVFIQRDAQGNEKPTAVQAGGVATDVPLVVLVDEGTASAAEILAGAIQDPGRAKLVGTTTYGTGTVLDTYTLADGSAVRIGVAEWLTPKGRQIWRHGIQPDIVVSLPADVVPLTPSDLSSITPQLLAASKDAQFLEALRQLPAGS